MIQLHRLNGESFTLNAMMIEQIQSHPDTTITLLNGKKIVVKTTEQEVMEKITAFYKQVGFYGKLIEVGESDE